MQPSPYTPGEVARAVPGRERQLAEIDERLSFVTRLHRLAGRIRVDIGARGLGKTSLLREAQRRAEQLGALTLWVTAGGEQPLIAGFASELERQSTSWSKSARAGVERTLRQVKLTVGVPGLAHVESTWAPAGAAEATAAPARQLEDLIRAAVKSAARTHPGGLVLFVDEIQEADPGGLRALATCWQHLQAEGSDVPAAAFAAGLPNAPGVIARVATFSERFAYRTMEPLEHDPAQVALWMPAREVGVAWDQDAIDEAVQLADGYPYTLQLVGDASWAAAGYPANGSVTRAHVQAAQSHVADEMQALYAARWDKATRLEQDFMAAMAARGDGPIERAAIAEALEVSTRELSVPRARLIDKGLVVASGRGALIFTVPGFAAWIRDQAH